MSYLIHEKNNHTEVSLSHGFFNYITSKKVTALHDAELDKRHRKIIQRLHDPHKKSAKNSRWKVQKNSATKNHEVMPQVPKINEP